MAPASAFLVALVLLSCKSISSLGCDLPQTHSLAHTRALRLLAQMRRISPFSCLDHRKDFEFPREAFGGNQVQKAQALSLVHEMLQQTFQLFSTDGSAAAWDQSLLGQFCTGLDQQLRDLEACVMQEAGLEGTPLLEEDPILAVRKYFHRLTLYLQDKNYSPCAWEIVRAEVMRSFSSSTNLQDRLRRKE